MMPTLLENAQRTVQGLIVSQYATVADRFNKQNWPDDVATFEASKPITSRFIVISITSTTQLLML